ncbi:MAG: ATPase, T2SS/T4P/T4SS family, partial [Oscillospiraceae bacterium]
MDNISSIRETMYTTRGEEPYELVLQRAQSQIASSLKKNIEAISESELKEIIEKHITAHGVKCNLTGSVTELTNYIYHDMAGLSFITRDKLFNREGFEEIDINAWNDVEIVINGKRTKTDYSFLSPQHAIDIHERMFRKTSTMFNDAKPRATADIGEGIRITAQKAPIVDADVAGVSSIRKVNMNVISRDALIDGKAITSPMFDFLLQCVKHGVSICLSGETGTGKTTLAGCLLSMAAQVLRIYTIEEGSREWNFVLKDEHGKPLNSVIHTRTRPNVDNPSLNIDQEDLVMDSLRFDPDIIAPGEIRGREAFEIMGVSNTGHTVVTTIHSNGTEDTP